MMPLLSDCPSGRRVMIDANVLAYSLSHEPTFGPSCTAFLQRVSDGDVIGYVKVAQLCEASHRLMLAEAANRYGLPQQGMLRRLQKDPDLIKPLIQHVVGLRRLVEAGLEAISVTESHLWSSHALRQTHGLLVNDSILLAVMLDQGMTDLVTQDSDFEAVPGITVWKPVVSTSSL